LRQHASSTIRFLGAVPVQSRADIYAGAIALLYPATNVDFAFAPVEAMGYGVPVIASEQSGLRDVVLNFRTGLLFPDATVESLQAAILQFEKLRFSSYACIERAKEFSETEFATKFQWFVAKALDAYHQLKPSAVEDS
jgi:glycosyltransferase involved in cell wall biosynthesis